MLSGGVDHICQAAFNYGKNVGLAFQVSRIHAPQCRHSKWGWGAVFYFQNTLYIKWLINYFLRDCTIAIGTFLTKAFVQFLLTQGGKSADTVF